MIDAAAAADTMSFVVLRADSRRRAVRQDRRDNPMAKRKRKSRTPRKPSGAPRARPGPPPPQEPPAPVPAPAQPSAAGSARRLWTNALAIVVIVVIGAASYSPTLNGGFLLDDNVIVVRNKHILSLENVPKLFTMNWWRMSDMANVAGNLYRPVVATTFAIDVALMDEQPTHANGITTGLDARTMHRGNIIYHCATSIVVLFLLGQLLGRRTASLYAALGAALFAAHPVHVEAVANIVGRAEILAGLFVFSAALVWARGWERGTRWPVAIAAAMLWFLAMLCKEIAVTLPLLLVGLDLALRRGRRPLQWLAAYLPFVVAALVYGALRHNALGDSALAPYSVFAPGDVSLWQRIMTMSHAFAYYWRLMFAPLPQCADYSGFPVIREVSPTFVRSAALHLVVIGPALYAAATGKGGPMVRRVAFGALGFYLILAPLSNIVVVTGVIVSERSMYVPSFCAILAMIAAIQGIAAGRPRALRVGLPVVALLLVALAVAGCRGASRHWETEKALFAASAEHPYCGHIGYGGLGRSYLVEQQYETALPYLNVAYEMRPNLVVLDHRARCFIGLERYPEAVHDLRNLLYNSPGSIRYLRLLARTYMTMGQPGKARQVLEEHPKLTTPGTLLHGLLGQAIREEKKAAE